MKTIIDALIEFSDLRRLRHRSGLVGWLSAHIYRLVAGLSIHIHLLAHGGVLGCHLLAVGLHHHGLARLYHHTRLHHRLPVLLLHGLTWLDIVCRGGRCVTVVLHASSLVDLMGMHSAQVSFLHLTPSAAPDNAHDDADADDDWQEDVEEDDGDGGLPTVIVIIVVAKTIFVVHLFKERQIDLSLRKG